MSGDGAGRAVSQSEKQLNSVDWAELSWEAALGMLLIGHAHPGRQWHAVWTIFVIRIQKQARPGYSSQDPDPCKCEPASVLALLWTSDKNAWSTLAMVRVPGERVRFTWQCTFAEQRSWSQPRHRSTRRNHSERIGARPSRVSLIRK